MEYLLDSGVLLRLVDRADPLHEDVRRAVRAMKYNGHVAVTTIQNISEFWNVCTRPSTSRGGLGLSVEEAHWRLRLVERIVYVLPDRAGIYAEWKKLLLRYRIIGVQVHDARIVAAMIVHGIGYLLTLNKTDFRRYTAIVAVSHADVLSAPPPPS